MKNKMNQYLLAMGWKTLRGRWDWKEILWDCAIILGLLATLVATIYMAMK